MCLASYVGPNGSPLNRLDGVPALHHSLFQGCAGLWWFSGRRAEESSGLRQLLLVITSRLLDHLPRACAICSGSEVSAFFEQQPQALHPREHEFYVILQDCGATAHVDVNHARMG